jgi:hypothetical protein
MSVESVAEIMEPENDDATATLDNAVDSDASSEVLS